jgi:hypothetical protein
MKMYAEEDVGLHAFINSALDVTWVLKFLPRLIYLQWNRNLHSFDIRREGVYSLEGAVTNKYSRG